MSTPADQERSKTDQFLRDYLALRLRQRYRFLRDGKMPRSWARSTCKALRTRIEKEFYS